MDIQTLRIFRYGIPILSAATLTAAKGKENELLHGELAPTANALYCPLEQPESEHTSFFPVLVSSETVFLAHLYGGIGH